MCGSWLAHWEKLSGKKHGECAACARKATVGALVQRVYDIERRWYVVPLCDECNRKSPKETFPVYEKLVSAVKCRPEKR